MESLTKENFWNDLQGKYPEQMKQFCDWIDEYKKRVDWRNLFGNQWKEERELDQVKYHDLPIAMQYGIFVQFVMESGWMNAFRLRVPTSVIYIGQQIEQSFFFNSTPMKNREGDETPVDHLDDMVNAMHGGVNE